MYFIIRFFNANFSTDLVKTIPYKTIDTVKDLAASESPAFFFYFNSIHTKFMTSNKKEYKQVWENCGGSVKTCLYKDAIFLNADKMANKSFIFQLSHFPLMKKLLCHNAFTSYRKLHPNLRVHVSKPFTKEQFAYIYGKILNLKLRNLINQM